MSTEPNNEAVVAELLFDRAIELGVDTGISTVQDRFELQPDYENWLPYHNSHHTMMVVEATGAILSAIQDVDPDLVSHREIKMGKLMAAWHDVVQEYSIEVDHQGIARRRMHRGPNEMKSHLELGDFMQTYPQVFTTDDYGLIRKGIDGTVPTFDRWNRITQPGASDQNLPITARAIAFADLSSGPGMYGPEQSLGAGRTNFIEQFPALTHPIKRSVMREEVGDVIAEEATAWLEGQQRMLIFRKQDFAQEISDLSPEIQAVLHELHDQFDASIAAAEAAYDWAQNARPEDLLDYMLQDVVSA